MADDKANLMRRWQLAFGGPPPVYDPCQMAVILREHEALHDGKLADDAPSQPLQGYKA